MKKLLLFGCVMTLLFVASSCSKNDEVYSCNSAVNEWAQKKL